MFAVSFLTDSKLEMLSIGDSTTNRFQPSIIFYIDIICKSVCNMDFIIILLAFNLRW